MRIVFAASNNVYYPYLAACKAENLLHSFEYKEAFLSVLQKFDIRNKFYMIDSGAFSAWSKGTKVNIDEYIDFCKFVTTKYPDNNWQIVNLDVIPGAFGRVPTAGERAYSAQKGWENYEYMMKKGIKPIHIFHQFEDFKWLKQLMASSDYIGVSPDNSQSVSSRIGWLSSVYAVVKDKVKTHGFACTGSGFLKVAPFYSVDSSSWSVGPRYGILTYFDQQTLSLKSFKLSEVGNAEGFSKFQNTVYPALSRYLKVSFKDLLTSRKNSVFMLKCAIEAYKQQQVAYTTLWARRGYVFQD